MGDSCFRREEGHLTDMCWGVEVNSWEAAVIFLICWKYLLVEQEVLGVGLLPCCFLLWWQKLFVAFAWLAMDQAGRLAGLPVFRG